MRAGEPAEYLDYRTHLTNPSYYPHVLISFRMRQAVIGLHEYAELSSSPLSTILFTKWLAIPLTSLSLHPEPNRLLPSTSLSLPDPPGTSSHPEFQSHQQEYRRSHSWSTHHPPGRHQYRHAFGPVLGSAAKAVMARFSHAPEEADLSAL